jgi:hypothetical protein
MNNADRTLIKYLVIFPSTIQQLTILYNKKSHLRNYHKYRLFYILW